MPVWLSVILVIVLIVVAVLALLYFLGNKMQKKQYEQQVVMEQMAQTVSMLIIDKKRMKFKDAGFPKAVVDQTPKYARRLKTPVVKAKVGNRIMVLMCDDQVFELLPVKQEVKVVLSGIYISELKSIRGASIQATEKQLKQKEKQKQKDAKPAAKAQKKASKK